NRANLCRHHPHAHRTLSAHSIAFNGCLARIRRRGSDLWRRCPDRPLRDVEFARSSDRRSVLVDRYGLFPERCAASRLAHGGWDVLARRRGAAISWRDNHGRDSEFSLECYFAEISPGTSIPGSSRVPGCLLSIFLVAEPISTDTYLNSHFC